MDPVFWLLGGMVACLVGAVAYHKWSAPPQLGGGDDEGSLLTDTAPVKDAATTESPQPSASMSPITKRGGKRLRRNRKDGKAYSDTDDIWDDELFEDCFDFLWGSTFELAENLIYEVMHPVEEDSSEVGLETPEVVEAAGNIEEAVEQIIVENTHEKVEGSNDDSVSNGVAASSDATDDVVEESSNASDFDDLPDTTPNAVPISQSASVSNGDVVSDPAPASVDNGNSYGGGAESSYGGGGESSSYSSSGSSDTGGSSSMDSSSSFD
jgi:hypothetical protein